MSEEKARVKSTNHYLEIGSSHDDCQDFAISGMINPTLAYAILSDGCSASHDICREVDFGARLIAYSARKLILDRYKTTTSLDARFSDEDVHAFLTKTALMAEEQRKFFGLHPTAIDATLLILISDGNRHNVVIYGDGGFVYRRDGEKTLNYRNVNFESGAPFYPSYSLDLKRLDAYNQTFGRPYGVRLHSLAIAEDGSKQKSDLALEPSYTNWFYKQTSFTLEGKIPFIALTSDGVNSFQRPHKDYPEIIEHLESDYVIPEMFGFKNLNGQFVERRMKRFKADKAEEKWTHYDDVSIAAISTAW